MLKKFISHKYVLVAIVSFGIGGFAFQNDQVARAVLPLVLGNNGQSAIEKFIYECKNAGSLGVAEDMLADSLIVSGWRAVSVVASRIDDASLPCRRYAIGFLGNVMEPVAIPQLEKIALNEKEEDYIRGDALEAIFQIDNKIGKKLASQIVNQSPLLKEFAGKILKNELVTERKSYWQAVFRIHD